MNAEQIMPGRLTIIVPLATIIKHILPSPPPRDDNCQKLIDVEIKVKMLGVKTYGIFQIQKVLTLHILKTKV